jgi:hypothetical protein
MSPGSPELAEEVARYERPDSVEQVGRAAEDRLMCVLDFPWSPGRSSRWSAVHWLGERAGAVFGDARVLDSLPWQHQER